MSLESAPFLLMGLVLAGCLVALLPASRLGRWLSGSGLRPILKAALIGTPLPLCSCSVVPVASGLRRAGASPGATLSFLITTPENGADSLAVSYALLGPVMTIARPIAAILSGIVAGLLAPSESQVPTPPAKKCGCCGGHAKTESGMSLGQGMRYAFSTMLDELLPWLGAGLLAAAALACLLDPASLAAWGSGLSAKIVMVLVGVPMYICASASTPVAASLLAAGISPGTVLVFLLAGPATNLGTLGVVRRELGNRSLLAYLTGACLVPVVCGVALDLLVTQLQLPVVSAHAHHDEHGWLSLASLLVLTFFALRPLRRRFLAL